MQTIFVETYAAMDWHDCTQTVKFLKENGNYDVRHPELVIAMDIFDSFISVLGDKCDFSYEKVIESVIGKKDFVLENNEDYDGFRLNYNAEKQSVTVECDTGYTSTSHYVVSIIPDSNVRYIVAENFLTPFKGVPSIQRFFTQPFEDIADAEKVLEGMQLHESVWYSKKELIIDDAKIISDLGWFKINMEIMEILKEHPELSCDNHFRISAETHLKHLQDVLAMENK